MKQNYMRLKNPSIYRKKSAFEGALQLGHKFKSSSLARSGVNKISDQKYIGQTMKDLMSGLSTFHHNLFSNAT